MQASCARGCGVGCNVNNTRQLNDATLLQFESSSCSANRGKRSLRKRASNPRCSGHSYVA
eukprot:2228867-Amphidinium_carterae.1